MAFSDTYRFLLDGVVITPIIGNEFKLNYKKENDSFFFRKILSDPVKLFGAEYQTIENSSIAQRFTFTIEKSIVSGWQLEFEGYFYKTDCEFDKDHQILQIKPLSDDGWEDLKKVLNNELNLIEILPPANDLKYKLRPILQILNPIVTAPSNTNNKIQNIVGASYWEEDIGILTSDDFDDIVNKYQFKEFRKSFNEIVFARYLTTLPTYSGVATLERVEDDISTINKQYSKISQEINTGNIQVVRDYQSQPNQFGRVKNCAGVPNDYYVTYDDPLTYSIPIIPSTWTCNSLWFLFDETNTQTELDNSEDIVLRDAYLLHDMIQTILSTETNLVFNATTDYSEFLYSPQDPIGGQVFDLLIAGKSNIINAFYEEPARKLKIRLNELFRMLTNTFNVYWHVEKVGTEKRLRLEHISWYQRGGSYIGQSVNIDLTNSFDPRNGKPLSFLQNQYKYKKSNMPQRYEYRWADQVSELFEGLPIKVLSPQVNDGLIEQRQSNNFTTDLNYVVANQNISLDGFFLFAANLNGSIYEINEQIIEVKPGVNITVQNGLLANKILLPLYQGYAMPAEDIEIDGVQVKANSITRNKQQKIDFTYEGLTLDPLKLITTDLGDGQIEELTLNLVNNKYSGTLNHDTE